jgi:hypothetical protein
MSGRQSWEKIAGERIADDVKNQSHDVSEQVNCSYNELAASFACALLLSDQLIDR